ncbi:MAG TPA: dNTP triphosphohydrolase [Clostridia bacterium]|nr:dNTP triphosphohydrolase [Clostridia bacterium]
MDLSEIRDKIYKELGTPPRYKDKIQAIQDLYLAPYATKLPKEGSRRNSNEKNSNFETRSDFQRDRDRIIHSSAFRRLMYKTQVFVNHEGDFYRTRMTHSLEVSQIARGIARSLGLNEDLTEAIALGHDLGHTPFGHAVEELLSDQLKNEHGFFHNENSVRVVDIIEQKYGTDNCGLNLTWEVREGILKHTKDHTEGIYEELKPGGPSSLEGQVVALSDTLAYVCHDLDDGINAKLIKESIDEGLLTQGCFDELVYESFGLKPGSGISALINTLIMDLVESSWNTIDTNNITTLEQVRGFTGGNVQGNRIIRLGKHEKAFGRLKKFVTEFVYNSPMTTIMDVKARKIVSEIYNTFWSDPKQMPVRIYKKFIDASRTPREGFESCTDSGWEYGGYVTTPARVLCDYIAEMTDRSALETYDKLFGPFTKI